jgi:hypothetical protein
MVDVPKVITEITLNQYEMVMAAQIGLERKLLAIENGHKDNHGFSGPGWNEDIEGACGEMAVSKFLGVYWGGGMGDEFKAPDVGDRIQVRTTPRHDGSLIVRKDAKDEHLYVLVTGTAPNFFLRGFISAADAKRDEFIQAPNGRPPAWFVPQYALLDIALLSDNL